MKFIYYFLFLVILSSCIFAQAKSDRVVLLELFTSTTCPPCAPSNQYLDAWLKNTCTFPAQLAILKYHVWWPSPGNDPYYLANTADPQLRNKYYANEYVPHAFYDGFNAGSAYSSWPSLLQSRKEVKSPFKISVYGSASSAGGNLSVSVGSDGSSFPSGQLILHCAIAESELSYTGPNGDPVHNFVMRKMLPDASGESFAIAEGQTKTFTRSFAWNQSWNFSKSSLIAFIQIANTREVLQAFKTELPKITTGLNDDLPQQPEDWSLSQNYPNPFNPSTVIKYSIPEEQFVSIIVYDALGSETSVLVDEIKARGSHEVKFEAGTLPGGVYYCRMRAGGFSETKKLLLVK